MDGYDLHKPAHVLYIRRPGTTHPTTSSKKKYGDWVIRSCGRATKGYGRSPPTGGRGVTVEDLTELSCKIRRDGRDSRGGGARRGDSQGGGMVRV